MSKKDPYTCVRCGYSTSEKGRMKKHLYCNKKDCPASRIDIIMTDDIKEYILINRVFHVPKEEAPSQTINHFHQMNNFLNTLDPMTKIKEYLSYKNVAMIPFDRNVEIKYEHKRLKLENNTFDCNHHDEHILEIVDQVSQFKEISKLNLIFHKDLNKFMIYESGEWQEKLAPFGVVSIINTIKDYFWNAYECFLIRRIEGRVNEVRMVELLEHHYRFLASVDVLPFIVDKHNKQIMFNMDDDEYWEEPEFSDMSAHTIRDFYMTKYMTIQQNLSRKDKEDAKKAIIDIIKRNTRQILVQLDKLILSLMSVDQVFKSIILPDAEVQSSSQTIVSG